MSSDAVQRLLVFVPPRRALLEGSGRGSISAATVVGYGGMQRRLYDANEYEFLRHLHPINVWITRAALLHSRSSDTRTFSSGSIQWSPPPEPAICRRGSPKKATAILRIHNDSLQARSRPQ